MAEKKQKKMETLQGKQLIEIVFLTTWMKENEKFFLLLEEVIWLTVWNFLNEKNLTNLEESLGV